MKKCSNQNKNQSNSYRKKVSEIKKELNSKKSAKKKRDLTSIDEDLKLWEKMEQGDLEALAILSVKRGLMPKEVGDQLIREAQGRSNEEGNNEEEDW